MAPDTAGSERPFLNRKIALDATQMPCPACRRSLDTSMVQPCWSWSMRCYYRCHDDERPALDPRWRDHHTLPDEWLYRLLFKRRKGGWRSWVKHVPWLWKASSRYALRHFHCPKDGQCVFRANHRGSCYWGNDDDD